MQKVGNISEQGMYNTFNMGIGMMLVVAPEEADAALKALSDASQKAFVIGKIQRSENKEAGVIL